MTNCRFLVQVNLYKNPVHVSCTCVTGISLNWKKLNVNYKLGVVRLANCQLVCKRITIQYTIYIYEFVCLCVVNAILHHLSDKFETQSR